ncbi:MAG: hypothetical protein WKF84_27895 [Pyrinomonadaceae bacterium]
MVLTDATARLVGNVEKAGEKIRRFFSALRPGSLLQHDRRHVERDVSASKRTNNPHRFRCLSTCSTG